MKFLSLLLVVLGGSLLTAVGTVRAQQPTATAPERTLYPDSPARANPKTIAPKRSASGEDGVRGPRGPLDWEHTEALSPDGRLFATRNADGRLRVWELGSGQSVAELPAGVFDVVFSPDSRSLACRFEKPSGQPGGRYWQVCTVADGKPAGGPLLVPTADVDGADLVFFSPDGRTLAGFLGTGANVRVVLWDAAGGQPRAVQPIKELFGGLVLAFSPDGKTLAAVGAGSGTALFSLPDLKPVRTLASSELRLLDAVTFSPDGKTLAVGGDEKRPVRGVGDAVPAASLYEVATGRLVAELKVTANRGGRVRQVLFANEGKALVTASERGLQAWSAVDGRLQAILVDGGYPVAVSADGRTLAAAQYVDLACWDTATWRLGVRIANARAGFDTGTAPQGNAPLVFAPDASQIVTLRGNSVAAWELPGGRPLKDLAATQTRAVQ